MRMIRKIRGKKVREAGGNGTREALSFLLLVIQH
jgi:hypothetical protein